MNDVRDVVDRVYREEFRRALATVIRLVGDFDLAEEALTEAFLAAVERWEAEGIPDNPRAWLVATARFKAIDTLRRRNRFREIQPELARRMNSVADDDAASADVDDDQLRLIFTCCHPALSPSVQVPLTLREVCGLTTEEIAAAFLTTPPTMAQRLVRGKAKIRDARIPYVIPERGELPERLDSVLSVIYLVFTEGYSSCSGESAIRAELCAEAIRLGRLLVELLPDPESLGLLALMLLQESRRTARLSAAGDLILLEDQDRSLWDRRLIEEGQGLVRSVFAAGEVGPYGLQAAIAAVHSEAESAAQTDWNRIVTLYDVLLGATGSPVVELNRAVAVAMRDGPAEGLRLIDDLLSRDQLLSYHLSHAARADLCLRLGRRDEARASYQTALELTKQSAERRFLQSRLDQLVH